MAVLCDVGVYVRSMYMSGRRVCEFIVRGRLVVFWAWGSVVGSLVCGPVVCVVSDMRRVSGIWG